MVKEIRDGIVALERQWKEDRKVGSTEIVQVAQNRRLATESKLNGIYEIEWYDTAFRLAQELRERGCIRAALEVEALIGLDKRPNNGNNGT